MAIRTEARLVKEQLSVDTVVPAAVSMPPLGQGGRRSVQISRHQLEELIEGGHGGEPGLVEAVRLVTAALATAPAGPEFAGALLVGGSRASRCSAGCCGRKSGPGRSASATQYRPLPRAQAPGRSPWKTVHQCLDRRQESNCTRASAPSLEDEGVGIVEVLSSQTWQ